VMNIWWNIFAFYKSAVPPTPNSQLPPTITHPLDKWLLSKIEGLTQTVTTSMDNYDVVAASRPLMAFAKEFSTWYLRLSRERLRENVQSQAVFAYALVRYSLLMAPFAPFMSERIYQNMPDHLDSIHLELWPHSNQTLFDPKLESSMQVIMQIIEKGHAGRKEANIRLRQPLPSLTTPGVISDEFKEIIKDELNVKSVLTGEFSLDTQLTPELIDEGTTRDLMRDIQGERKRLGLSPGDVVTVTLPSWPKSWTVEIKRKVGASSLTKGDELKVVKI